MPPELAGLLHGVAELHPVSSSAHARLCGADPIPLALGALPAIAWRWRVPLRPGLQLAALVPPVVVGAAWSPRSGPLPGLVAGTVALAAAPGTEGGRSSRDAGWRDGLALGVAQAVALQPGVSRLGATTVAARLLGFADPEALAREVALPVTVAAVARSASAATWDRAALRGAAGSLVGAALGPARLPPRVVLAWRFVLAVLVHRGGG